jgi:hypothetical protein
MKFYKDRQAIDCGGGSGLHVTNAFFKNTAKHSMDFGFVHCHYSNFKGTVLSWKHLWIIVSDQYLDPVLLNEYTDSQCVELIMQHVSGEVMLEHIADIAKRAHRDGIREFQQQLRKMILE